MRQTEATIALVLAVVYLAEAVLILAFSGGWPRRKRNGSKQ